MFKRSFAAMLMLAVLLSLFGCGGNTQAVDDSYNYLTDAPLSKSLPVPSDVNIVKCETGYYVLVGKKLYFVDSTCFEATPLCSRPNCLHSDDNCSAIIGAVRNIAYSDNYIYYVASAGAEKEFIGAYLVRLSPDGSAKENVYYLEEDITEFVIHRGYFYFSSRKFEVDESTGLPDIDKYDSYIYRLALDGSFKEPEEVYFAEEVERYCQLTSLMVYGDNLYFDLYGIKRGTKNEEILKSMKLNLTTREVCETVTESGFSLTRPQLLGDSLIFSSGESENGKFLYYKTDFNGNNPEKFFATYDGESVFCDGKYLYVDNFFTLAMPHTIEENDNVRSDCRYIKVYNGELNLIDEFSFGTGSAETWYILPADSEVFLFGGDGKDGDVIFYYDKSEFGTLNGKEWEKTFSYKETG